MFLGAEETHPRAKQTIFQIDADRPKDNLRKSSQLGC